MIEAIKTWLLSKRSEKGQDLAEYALLIGLIALIVILVLNRNVFEAMALSLPAVVVFRGGLGMIRMATASRIARRISEPEELTVARSYPSPQSR